MKYESRVLQKILCDEDDCKQLLEQLFRRYSRLQTREEGDNMVKCLVFLLSSCTSEVQKQKIAQHAFARIPNHYSQLDEEFYNSLVPYLS